jgi:hypothetical protein
MKSGNKTKVVIAGSASLQGKISEWRNYWNDKDNHIVIDFPLAIKNKNFIKIYPEVHKKFFRNILKADILFIVNEDKNGINGYIGAEVFAELVYGLMQNLISGQKIKIILAKMPSQKVQSFEEIKLWLKLGWIKIYKKL